MSEEQLISVCRQLLQLARRDVEKGTPRSCGTNTGTQLQALVRWRELATPLVGDPMHLKRLYASFYWLWKHHNDDKRA